LPPPQFKYLNYLPRHGFGASFMVTLATLDYCIDNDLFPYVDVRSDGYAETTDVNIWGRLFNQPFSVPSSAALDWPVYTNFDVIGHPNNAYGTTTPDLGYWKLTYVNNLDGQGRQMWVDKAWVGHYRDIVKEFVVVNNPEVLSNVSEFTDKYAGKSVLGLHRRGRSHFAGGHGRGQAHLVSDDIVSVEVERRLKDFDYLYLTSDEAEVYSYYQSKFGDKVVIFDDKSQYNPTHGDDLNRHDLNPEQRKELLVNLMSEMLILSKCDERMLTGSNISCMSIFFTDDDNYSFYDNAVVYYTEGPQ
jgi:hypothetical protein